MKNQILVLLMTIMAMAAVPAIANADEDGYTYPGAPEEKPVRPEGESKKDDPAPTPDGENAVTAQFLRMKSDQSFGFTHFGYSHTNSDVNKDANGGEAAIGYYTNGGFVRFGVAGQQNDYLNLKLDLSHLGVEPVCAGPVCVRLETTTNAQWAAGKGTDGSAEFNGRASILPVYRVSVGGVDIGVGAGLQGGFFASNRMLDDGKPVVMGGIGPNGLLTLDWKMVNAQLGIDHLFNLQGADANRTRGVTNIDAHVFGKFFESEQVAMGLYGDFRGTVVAQDAVTKTVEIPARNGFDYTFTTGYEIRFGRGSKAKKTE